jgi:hypothetical protein
MAKLRAQLQQAQEAQAQSKEALAKERRRAEATAAGGQAARQRQREKLQQVEQQAKQRIAAAERVQQQVQQQAEKQEKQAKQRIAAAERAQQQVQQQAEKQAEQQKAQLAVAEADAARWQALARQSDEWAEADDPAHVATSLADSNFKPQYDYVQRVKPLQPQQKDRVLYTVRRIVEGYCAELYPGDAVATPLQIAAGCKFLLRLQNEWRLEDEADTAAERVWSSQKTLPLVGAGGVDQGGGGVQRELCSIFSQALRDDRASVARATEAGSRLTS